MSRPVHASHPPRRVPVAQGANYAGCSYWTLRRRIDDGTITGYRSGPRLILVDLDEIDAKLLRRIPTPSEAGRPQAALDHYVQRIVDQAPDLTEAQRDRLSLLLRGDDTGSPGGDTGPDAA